MKRKKRKCIKSVQVSGEPKAVEADEAIYGQKPQDGGTVIRRVVLEKIKTQEDAEEVASQMIESHKCLLCNDKGYRELDKAGLIRVRCKCKSSTS